MESITQKDAAILRALAEKQVALAQSDRNKEILAQWEALAQGRREAPTVRLLFSNFPHEVITPRMRCEGAAARDLENRLLRTMAGRELFDDDTPISPTFDLEIEQSVSPFGVQPHITHSTESQGYHIDPVITDLNAQFDLLNGGSFEVHPEKTAETAALAQQVFGDILPPRIVMNSLAAPLTSPLVHLMGMEGYYIAMLDCPEKVCDAMELACSVYEAYYDYLEEHHLLRPTQGISPIMQESFAFNHELPGDAVTKTTQCWGFMESQETTAVSAEMFGEFVFPYQERLAKRFGLLSYGCCERVDATWPDYLSKFKNLRKLSVSPFNDEALVGSYLRGSNVVFYSKPRAEYVTNRGPLDEDAITAYFKGVAEHASGCLLEVAQREVGTLYGDANRGRRYVALAKAAIEKYWRP